MSVYISNLPLYTGNTYNGYIIWNDSGETTTYKTLYKPQFLEGSGTNAYKTPLATASGTNSIGIGGFTSPRTLVVSGDDAIGIGSTDGSQPLPNDMIMIGHRTSQQASTRGVVVGTASQIYSNGVVVGSDCSSQSESIIVGNSSRGFGYRNINIGHSITFNTGTESIAIGSAKSILNVGDYEIIFGGQSTTMTGTGNHQTLIGGHSNTIGGTTSYSTILGGKDNTITGGTYQVMLGTSGRTASADNTTYTENHASFGQSYQGYYDNGSGSTFTINWNNGNTQKMSFTGAGGITCNNTQTGAHYRMVINNPNGYTPTSFTAAGRTIKFNGGSFVVYSGESICELFITNDSVFVNQLGLFS